MNPLIDIYAPKSVFRYIANEYEANNALRHIQYGEIGFDTEYKEPAVEPSDPDATVGASGSPWDNMKLCVVQIAIPGWVYIVDLKRIRTVPGELARIISSSRIDKAGVGLTSDAKVIWDGIGVGARRFVDVGLMAKFANPEWYAEEAQSPLSLERCVRDYLNQTLDKKGQKDLKWGGTITKEHLVYAGLDAQASLEVYRVVSRALKDKATELGRFIPEDWYTFDYRDGHPTRLLQTVRGKYLPWSPRFCPWYYGGQFQGYYF